MNRRAQAPEACWPWPLVVAALGLWPTQASAHLVSTGLGPFYDGISHFFLSLDDILPVLAMAILGGLQGKRGGRQVLFALPAAWLAGGLAGYVAGGPELARGITAVSALMLGALVAADRQLAPAVVLALACALGLLHGWMNGASVAAAKSGSLALPGIAASVFVTVALVAAMVIGMRVPWLRIATRVAGSWIAAVGLLLLGWSLRG